MMDVVGILTWVLGSRLLVIAALRLGLPKPACILIPVCVAWAIFVMFGEAFAIQSPVSTAIKMGFVAPLIVYLRWWWWPRATTRRDPPTSDTAPPPTARRSARS